MKRPATEELKQGRSKKQKVERLFESVYIDTESRWFCEECKTYQQYLDYLLQTDLIYDVDNLRTKSLDASKEADTTLQYLEKLFQDDKFIDKHTPPKLLKFWPIIGLKHNTSEKNIDSIVKHGLFTPLEIATMGTISSYGADREMKLEDKKYHLERIAERGGAFPGIFLTAIRQGYEREDLQGQNYSTDYTIILDPYLLNRNDYHINLRDQYGQISQDTFSRKNIADLLDHLGSGYSIGEIVFHNHIEPEFIKKVWKRKRRASFKKALSTAAKIGATEEEYPTEPTFYDLKPNKYLKLLDHPPRFCTRNFDTSSNKALFRVARNCQVKPKDAEQTWRDIKDQYEKYVLSNKFPESIYYPPFTDEYSPLSPDDEEDYERFDKDVF